jgi:hypothetical protein
MFTSIFEMFSRFMVLSAIFIVGPVIADEDSMSPLYEMNLPAPKTDLSARPLAGKYLRYGYHSFWEVNKNKGPQGAPAAMVHDILFYENGECEWFSLDIFAQDFKYCS